MLSTKEQLSLQDSASLWGILNFYVLERSHIEVYFLQAEDTDLKKFLRNFLKNVIEKEISNLRQFLSNNNIDYPINYPSRNLNLDFELNEATKYRDMEVAMLMLQTIRAALPVFSAVIMNSYSEEVINKVSGYYNGFLDNMKAMLKLADKKAWVRKPPLIHLLKAANK
ncbi:MAG: DUF3231 family protein [Ruminiclostridium sp.]|nr:DUF3231 family protein [Ruminiclostridium sp.]